MVSIDVYQFICVVRRLLAACRSFWNYCRTDSSISVICRFQKALGRGCVAASKYDRKAGEEVYKFKADSQDAPFVIKA